MVNVLTTIVLRIISWCTLWDSRNCRGKCYLFG